MILEVYQNQTKPTHPNPNWAKQKTKQNKQKTKQNQAEQNQPKKPKPKKNQKKIKQIITKPKKNVVHIFCLAFFLAFKKNQTPKKFKTLLKC